MVKAGNLKIFKPIGPLHLPQCSKSSLNETIQDLVRAVKTNKQHQCLKVMFTVWELLPIGEGGDERGGLEDFAGGDGVCGRGLKEVWARWRNYQIMEGKKAH